MSEKMTFERPATPPPRKELNDTPVKLCNEISRLFHARLRNEASMDGVMSQPGARLVLSFLAIGDGINQLELVKATHLSAPTVSVILRKMEEDGLVERVNDENDMRSVRVYLTERGKALDEENIRHIKSLDAIGTTGISADEYDTLMHLLKKIRDNIADGKGEKNEKNI